MNSQRNSSLERKARGVRYGWALGSVFVLVNMFKQQLALKKADDGLNWLQAQTQIASAGEGKMCPSDGANKIKELAEQCGE